MRRLIGITFARIFAVICMLAVPGILLHGAYDAFVSYNEDGMSLLEGIAIFARGGAFVFFTFIIWVLAIEVILCDPNKDKTKDKKD